MKTLDEIHDFWKNPSDTNLPKKYITGERSLLLLDLFKQLEIEHESSILELGCNVGRNLNALYGSGYKNLSGIEININAKAVMKKEFPLVYKNAHIYWDSIENITMPHADTIYTMAVLEHIHPDSEWIFEEMVSKANKHIITIEDEHGTSWRHFVRNYKNVFENLGLTQIYEYNCEKVPGLNKNFFARIFTK